MPPRIVAYGRRVSSNRFARRIRTRIRPATRRREPIDPHSIIVSDSQEIRNLRGAFAAGNIPRVPRSTYCAASSLNTLRRYRKIAKQVAKFQTREKRRRDIMIESRRDEAMESVANATRMTKTADEMHRKGMMKPEIVADMLNEATRILLDATNILRGVVNLEIGDHDIVFVYDVDEITMMDRDYVAEFMTLFPEVNSHSLFKLPNQILNTVQLSSYDISLEDIITMYHVNEDSDFWRQFGPRYRILEVLYNEISIGYKEGDPDISQELCNRAGLAQQTAQLRKTVAELQKRTHQRWRLVRKCLELVEQKSRSTPGKYANVVISSEGVAHGAAKLMISGHSSYVPINNIYSKRSRNYTKVFEKLVNVFGETCVFVRVTSTSLPEMPQFRQWPVEAVDSFKKLYKAQKNHFLQP